MKYTNHALYHAFAHQTDTDAQNANGSMFIDGDTVFSYGRHFPMARHAQPNIILFTTDSYSNTTAKQLSQLGGAIPPSKTVFRVVDVLANDESAHLANFKDYISRYIELLEQASRARNNKEWLLDQAHTLAARANSYAYNFDVKHAPINTDGIDLDSIKEVVTARKAEEKKQAEKLERKKQREQAKQIKAWQNCEPNTRAPSTNKVYLRIVKSTNDILCDNIQTSKGAQIPVNDAPHLWNMVTTCRKEKQTFIPDDKFIKYAGNYNLNKIDSKGNLSVDCHYIEYDQIKRLAKLLNYI
jgi:hypothetical protein